MATCVRYVAIFSEISNYGEIDVVHNVANMCRKISGKCAGKCVLLRNNGYCAGKCLLGRLMGAKSVVAMFRTYFHLNKAKLYFTATFYFRIVVSKKIEEIRNFRMKISKYEIKKFVKLVFFKTPA